MVSFKKGTGYIFALNHEALILLMATIVAFLVYLIFPTTYFPDSDQYYNLGRAILGEENDDTSNFRGLGLPFLLIGSGVFALNSFKLFVFLQMLMGVLIPVILYRLFSFRNKKYAFLISILTIFSLLPFGYAKAILSEQVYMFVLLVLIYNSIKLQETHNTKHLYLQAILIFLLIIIKPVANLLPVIFIIYSLLIFKRKILHIVLSFILLFTMSYSASRYNDYLFKDAPDHQKREQMMGSILFYNLYLSSDIEGEDFDLNEIENLRRILGNITSYYLNHPVKYYATLESYKNNPEAFKSLFKPHINSPVTLSQAIIEKPSKYYYSYIYESANLILGNDRSDKALLDASVEIIRKFPLLALGYTTRNLLAFARGKHISYSYYVAREKRITEYFPPSLEPLTWVINVSPQSTIPFNLFKELDTGSVNQIEKYARIRDFLLVEIWGRLFLILRPIVFLCMLLGVFFFQKERDYFHRVLCCSVVIYHMLIICIFNMPLNRYLLPTLVLELFSAASFLYVFVMKNKENKLGANFFRQKKSYTL